MSFPSHCLRGIPNTSFLEDGNIGSHLFYFPEIPRGDGWKELSINWVDDDLVFEFTLSQKKEDGEFQFKSGFVIVPRNEIDRLKNRLTIPSEALAYERQSLDENPYHGNILLQKDVSRKTMKLIAAGLTLAISEIRLK